MRIQGHAGGARHDICNAYERTEAHTFECPAEAVAGLTREWLQARRTACSAQDDSVMRQTHCGKRHGAVMHAVHCAWPR